MSKRETPPNPFGEATVVQSRTSNTPPPLPTENQSEGGGEKTVVHARSNLKETFDARTVVRPASTLPKDMPPVPKAEEVKNSEPPKATAVAAKATEPAKKADAPKATAAPKVPEKPKLENSVASFAVNSSNTSPAIDKTGGAILLKSAEVQELMEKSKKEKKPREPRKPLDQKTKLFIAGGAAAFVLALIFMFTGGSSSEAPANQTAANTEEGEESLASQETPDSNAAKFQQLSGPPASTTTDVLNRFDRASQRAQEKAESYSKSSGGF